jgi:hypothetical protein
MHKARDMLKIIQNLVKSSGKQLKIKGYNHIVQIVLNYPNRNPFDENKESLTFENYI